MKYKNKLKITRSLSFLLVMLMLLLQVPFSAVAEGDAVAPPTSDDVTLEGEAELFEFETISTVREVTEWREENVKHFTLPNGTYQAVTYADPVHRKDDAGVWQDIDNSLSLQSFKGVSLLANADMRTVFAPSFAANTPLFTLSENGYGISMSYLSTGSGLELTAIGAETTPAAVTNAPTRTKTEWDSIEEASTVDNKTSIVYSGVRTNTDLEYILQGNDIKENIIVKAPATSYVYRFELALVGLTAQMNEDGSISLRDATTGDAKYSIPAPYMVDANGERSNEVAYTLTALSTGGYRLTVTANAAWINAESRAFPVKIDPSINYDTGIIDTHISSQQPNTSFGNYEDLVIAPNYGSYAYIKTDLPTLPVGADVISAKLRTDYYYEGTEDSWVMLGAYQVTSAWNESLTWNQHLAGQGTFSYSGYCSYEYAHYFSGMSDYWNDTIEWDITDPLEDWYEDPTTNFGIAFQYEYDDPYTVYIKSSEAAFGCPYMTVQYSYLADGVYSIYSTCYQNRWMTVENDSTEPGANLQQTYGTTSPVADFDRSSLFKISYRASTDSYIIRSMLNNNLGLGYSADLTKVITKTIPSIDAQVPANDTFKIEWHEDGNGFKLYPNGNSSYVISITSTSTANLAPVYKPSSAAPAVWRFARWYTGEDQSGVDISFGTLIAGESYTKKLVVWSTVIDANIPQAYISSGQFSIISFDWDSASHLFTLAAHRKGFVTVAYRINKKISDDETQNVYEKFEIIDADLPHEEGIYYFRNAGAGTGTEIYYLQVDDAVAPNYSTENASLEVLPLVADAHQRWELEHISNGYYKIVSVKSGKVLAVQSSYEDSANQSLVQQTYSTSYRQMWKLEKITDYGYVLRPRSAESCSTDWCMGVSGTSGGYQVVQTSYTNSMEELNEWCLVSKVISLVNYYDSTFVNDSQKRQNIETASEFANFVYSKYYNVGIYMDGVATQYATVSDSCSRGPNWPCDSSICGSVCSVDHHKNIFTVSDQLYNDPREDDHIYVLWTNREYGTYCQGQATSHFPFYAIAVVCDKRPIIHFLTIAGDADVQLACMTLNLVHEIAHTLGMDDVYNNSGHDVAKDTICVMEAFDENTAYNFYSNVYGNNQSPFCNSCDTAMKNYTSNISISGN